MVEVLGACMLRTPVICKERLETALYSRPWGLSTWSHAASGWMWSLKEAHLRSTLDLPGG